MLALVHSEVAMGISVTATYELTPAKKFNKLTPKVLTISSLGTSGHSLFHRKNTNRKLDATTKRNVLCSKSGISLSNKATKVAGPYWMRNFPWFFHLSHFRQVKAFQ